MKLGVGETTASRAKTVKRGGEGRVLDQIGGDSNGSGTKWVGSIQKVINSLVCPTLGPYALSVVLNLLSSPCHSPEKIIRIKG